MSTLTDSIQTAVKTLAHGGIVALPTEGVYGLSCDPRQLDVVKRLCKVKQRPEDKGFVLVGASLAQLQPYILPLNAEQLALVNASWPGPVTWIVPVNPTLSPLVHGKEDTIAVRVTAHPILSAVCEQFGSAVISTSANISNKPPAMTAGEIDKIFSISHVDYILEGPLGELSGPTEIRDLRSRAIIRPLL